MVAGKNYHFEACECLGVAGNIVQIPAGIWPVAELSTVSVLINGSRLDLDSSAFQQLKLEFKASPVVPG